MNPRPSQLSRRGLLGAASALLAVPALGRALPASASRKEAKNIIFCVSDGMNPSVPAMAAQFCERVGMAEPEWGRLSKRDDVVHGLMDVRVLNSLVPDSAAAASAWGSGRHVLGGMINAFPDGTQLTPITQLMADAGLRCGLVTTSTITHATPAGFAISAPSRGAEADIAALYLDAPLHVLMGGGRAFFDPAKREDGRDLFAEFAAKGFRVGFDRAALTGEGKFLGLFSEPHVPFEIDRLHDATHAGVPTLAEMAEAAIRRLQSPEGFFLMIEGARVDHAGHANDVPGIVYDQLAFEQALAVAMRFAEEDGETLVVVTTDHGCGGPTLRDGGLVEANGFDHLLSARRSFETLLPRLEGADAAKAGQEVLAATGFELNDDEVRLLVDADLRTAIGRATTFGFSAAPLGMVLGRRYGVGWGHGGHSGEWAPVLAFGPGSAFFEGLTMNRTWFDHLLSLRGLAHLNPSMTLEEALRARETSAKRAQALSESELALWS